ncbi:hypothetical protein RJ639_038971 [Escallonia herrerae]|uniref:Transposase (putative) gypsy type domain-containing protein n=1 Tax=Escallonia herrerae TaxID=1293975 RepID=A0AA88WSR9_9ASTE|nr:hypothetical protein RJ639_038971 [Escallonia herrerae]
MFVHEAFCSGRVMLDHNSARAELCYTMRHSAQAILCSGRIAFGRLALCSGRVFGHDSAWAESRSATWHSTRAECSSMTLFEQNHIRPLGTLLGQSVPARLCWSKIAFGPLALCWGRVFGHDSARAESCSATWHSGWAECLGTTLLGKNRFQPFGTLLGQSVRAPLSSGRVLGSFLRVPFAINAFERKIFKFQTSLLLAYDTKHVRVLAVCFLFRREYSHSSSSSSRSERVSTSRNEVGTSNPQLPQPSSSEPLHPSSFQPPQPSTSQPSHSLPVKNALRDVKDQVKDEANPKPWYTADEKSSKMSTEDLLELLREYPLPEGWYARLPGLQELANYGTKFETGIYEEQVKSGYRLPLHPFALCFFEHYHMAPRQLVPTGWRKLVGLIYLQLEWARIIPHKPVPAGAVTPPPASTISSTFPTESVLTESQEKEERKVAKRRVAPAPKKTRVTPPDRSLQIVEKVFVDEDPIFRRRWTLRHDDVGMPDSQISEQHLVHGVLPQDKEIF